MAQIISVYDRLETAFTDNGVVLSDVVSCEIEEVLNGKYTLELEHPIDEKGKWELLVEENVIKADGQLFRIHKAGKELDYIKVYARHIFYDLLSNFLEDVRPTNLNGAAAIDWVLTGTQYAHPFTGTSDITGTNTAYFIRKNPVEAILGPDGLCERWNAELERDNFQIRLWEARGEDKGAHIVYGKNLLGIEIDSNYDDIATRLMPVGAEELTLPEKYVDSPLINNYTFPRVKTVRLPIGVNSETTEEQAYQQMRDHCNELYSVNKIDLPYESIKVDMVLLENTEEYKNFSNLIKVELGDVVGCTDNPLNVTFSAKAVRVKKDVLSNRNVEIELGQIKRSYTNTLSTVIKNMSYELVNTKSDLQQSIENATNLLTSALGGYVLKRAGELLIMDTEDPTTATKVWRWNLNGLGYSDNGINGPYELAMTIDGVINADFIATGTLSASLVKTGVLSSHDNSIWINLDANTFNFNDQLYWDNGVLRLVSPDIPDPVDTSAFAPKVFGGGLMEISDTEGFVAYKDSSKDEFTQLYPDGLFRVSMDGTTEVKRPYFFERFLEVDGAWLTKIFQFDPDDPGTEYNGDPTVAEVESELSPIEYTVQLPSDFIGKPFRVLVEPYLGDGEFIKLNWRLDIMDSLGNSEAIKIEIRDTNGNLWDGLDPDTMPTAIKNTGTLKIKCYMIWRGATTIKWQGYDYSTPTTFTAKMKFKVDAIA